MEAGRHHAAAAAAAVGDNFTDDIHPFVEADPVLCCTDERKVHAVKEAKTLLLGVLQSHPNYFYCY